MLGFYIDLGGVYTCGIIDKNRSTDGWFGGGQQHRYPPPVTARTNGKDILHDLRLSQDADKAKLLLEIECFAEHEAASLRKGLNAIDKIISSGS